LIAVVLGKKSNGEREMKLARTYSELHAIERRRHFHSPDNSPPLQNGDAVGNYQADERNLFLLHQLSAPSPAADALAIIPDPVGLKNFSSIREQEQHTGDLGRKGY
jgi:hypothetical protein